MRWKITTLAVLLAGWHSTAVQAAYSAGHRDGFRLMRSTSMREARQRSRECAYPLGYRHGKKDSGALKLVVDNPAPIDLYPARHQGRG